jgi:hypothetical protein
MIFLSITAVLHTSPCSKFLRIGHSMYFIFVSCGSRHFFAEAAAGFSMGSQTIRANDNNIAARTLALPHGMVAVPSAAFSIATTTYIHV